MSAPRRAGRKATLIALALLAANPAASAVFTPQAPPSAAADYDAAVETLRSGDTAGARAQFEALIKSDPRSAGPYLGLAETATRQGDAAAAEAALAAGIAAVPNVPELFLARARLHVLQRRFEAASVDYQKAIALSPSVISPHLAYADMLAQMMNQPQRALDEYKAASAIDPNDAAALYGQAYALVRLHRKEEAVAVLKQAQALAPRNPLPPLTLGQVYASDGNMPAALAAFEAALQAQPTYLPARLARADLQQAMGHMDAALADYRTALAQDPKSVPALLGVAMTLQGKGSLADAERGYRAVLAVEPKQTLALNNLAALLSARRDTQAEAVALARQAVDSAPDLAEAHDTLGWALRQRGDLDGAAAELQRALALGPSPIIYTHLGTVLGQQNNYLGATEAFRKALTLSPTYAPAQQGLRALAAPRPAPGQATPR